MKKKILAVALASIMLLVAITGTSLAYLTDKDDQVNTFTSGKVDITLDEAKVELDADGYLSGYNGRTSDDQSYGKMYPGQVITKDPTITVTTDSEKAYVAAKITITATDLESLIGTGYEGLLGITDMVSGGLVKTGDTMKPTHPLYGTLPVYGDDTYSVYQEKVAPGVHVIYIFIETIMAPGDSVTLFDTIKINPAWTNEQMAKIVDLKVAVNAYAVQIQTFANCYDAMTTAFATDFDFS